MTVPDPRTSRRAYRAALEHAHEHPRHAQRGVFVRRRIVLAGGGILVIGAIVAILGALLAPARETPEPASAAPPPRGEDVRALVQPLPPEGLPTPRMAGDTAVRPAAVCDDPALAGALAAGDDAGVIAALGGGEGFRAAVASGTAPCVRLDDPGRVWVVVNKQRPYVPIDAEPSSLVVPEGVRSRQESALRADAAAALTALVRGAADAGAGEIGMESAYRSYRTQQSTYAGHVSSRGVEGADLVSARPGFSEHQSGLTVDVVPCAQTCATIDDIAASPQGAWIAAHAWEYGWIVRYAEGRTDVTGYIPEPWHLRYVGPELARAYHEGGWTTLEEFFGLPAAPSYAP